LLRRRYGLEESRPLLQFGRKPPSATPPQPEQQSSDDSLTP
jgi:hypothetical protein